MNYTKHTPVNYYSQDCEIPITLNKLAREQMKEKLLHDILIDINICRLEGWEYKSYLIELRNMLDSFIKEEI